MGYLHMREQTALGNGYQFAIDQREGCKSISASGNHEKYRRQNRNQDGNGNRKEYRR